MFRYARKDSATHTIHVRQTMAVHLFKHHLISLAGAAKLADETIGVMLARLARLGIAIADYDGPTLAHEVKTAQDWLSSRK